MIWGQPPHTLHAAHKAVGLPVVTPVGREKNSPFLQPLRLLAGLLSMWGAHHGLVSTHGEQRRWIIGGDDLMVPGEACAPGT